MVAELSDIDVSQLYKGVEVGTVCGVVSKLTVSLVHSQKGSDGFSVRA